MREYDMASCTRQAKLLCGHMWHEWKLLIDGDHSACFHLLAPCIYQQQ